MTDALSSNPTAENEGLPPLEDPYLHGLGDSGAAVAQKPAVSGLAATSVVAPLLLPVIGGVAGIVFGWFARREIEASGGSLRGNRLAAVGMVLGVLVTLGWGAAPVVVWNLYRQAHPTSDEQVVAAPDLDPPSVAAPFRPLPQAGSQASPGPQGQASPSPPASGDPALGSSPKATAALGYAAPKTTTTRHEGAITVADVGVSASSLAEALAEQRAEASRAGETMLVMTTAGRCDPCRGVDTALRDPLMQTALGRVRLVRVDTTVFAEDLRTLKIPADKIPGFFLLGVNLSPRDGIDGGEWDDDIAKNIAPVLGAFVRGKYSARREAWKAVPGSGMRL